MNTKKLLAILALNLALAACIIQTEAQTDYPIGITNNTWDHTTIRVVITTPGNQTWWDPESVDLTLRAIDTWNKAFSTFSSMKQDLSYVSNIKLVKTQSSGTDQDFDVHVTYVEQLGADAPEAVGRTRLTTQTGVIKSAEVILAAKDLLSIPITGPVKEAIALHEIGHALGLLHTDKPEDLMYAQASFDITVRPVSTLDAYGVAQVYRWRAVSSQYEPSNQEPDLTSVSLPSDMGFEYLNPPQQDPITNTISNFLKYVQTIEGLIVFSVVLGIIIGITAIISAVIGYARDRKKQTMKANST